MKKKFVAAAFAAMVIQLVLARNARAQDFGQLRASVPACSAVSGPAAGATPTCRQWLALAGCITSAARSAPSSSSLDGGTASTCGSLAENAGRAIGAAQEACASASRADRAEIARLNGQLASVRAELTACLHRSPATPSAPTPPATTEQVRLPVCLPGDRNGNAELWCQTRDGGSLMGDACRRATRSSIRRAACQCPEGSRLFAVGPEVDDQGNRLPRGYACASVFREEGGAETVVPPPGANDPSLATRITTLDTELNTLRRDFDDFRERSRDTNRRQDAALAVACGLEPGTTPTSANCRTPSAVVVNTPANLRSPASHSVWANYMLVARTTGAVSNGVMGGYGVSLALGASGRVRLPISIGAVAADSGMNGIGAVYGYAAQLGIAFRPSQTVEIGATAQFVHFMDFGAQDPRLEPIGDYRGIFAGVGVSLKIGLGAGFSLDPAAMVGYADSIALDPRTQRFVAQGSPAVLLRLGFSWQTP